MTNDISEVSANVLAKAERLEAMIKRSSDNSPESLHTAIKLAFTLATAKGRLLATMDNGLGYGSPETLYPQAEAHVTLMKVDGILTTFLNVFAPSE